MSEKVKTSEKGIHNRSRYFCIVTYASEKQLRKVIRSHISSVRAFCYIYHDKDEAEPHYHVLLRTHSAWTPKQICRWFGSLIDAEKKEVNTFTEVAYDMEAQKDYLTHADPESRAEGKYLYSPQDIRSYGWDDLSERKDCRDTSYEILCKLMEGASYRDLVRFYGRDFLYHYNHYTEVADLILHQESRWGFAKKDLDFEMKRFETQEDVINAKMEEIEDMGWY